MAGHVEERLNAVLAAGCLHGSLSGSRVVCEPVFDDDGQATGERFVWFPGILESRYRVSIIRDPELGPVVSVGVADSSESVSEMQTTPGATGVV